MLDVLSDGFKQAKAKFKGKTTLKEENVKDAVAAIRTSLLEADVEFNVAKNFVQRVKEQALGKVVQLKTGKGDSSLRVSPGDHFVKICQDELESLMGPVSTELEYPSNRPATVMMVGLQGCGKTTTSGKLAKFLVDKQKKKPLLVAADIYRPAAVQQLKVLGERLSLPVFHKENADPVTIATEAIKEAYHLGCNVVIIDTAGRLTIDKALMQELSDIKSAIKPDNTLLVCDAMMGQDAVTTAKAFDESLALSGVVVTKIDGDARGGAALSIKEVTGKPIKFIGTGEGLDLLEEFRPEGLASRILGMGDIVGLMEDFDKVSEAESEKDAEKMLKGQFSFADFYRQIQMIQKMGPLKDVIAKLPMQDMLPAGASVDDREIVKVKAIIDSMTKKERSGAQNLDQSRMRRIARGSGSSEKDVSEMVKKFQGMKKMMGMMGKNMGGLLNKIPGIGKMNQMRQLSQSFQGADLEALGGMVPGADPSKGGGQRRLIDRDKQKKQRKAAKQARKKNRKK